MLSNDELQHGFWGSRQRRNVFPKPIVRTNEIRDTDVLSVACTQTGLPPKEQRKLHDEWCEALPHLGIKTLLFRSKVSQKLFDAAAMNSGLEALYIKWSSIKSFEAISQSRSLVALNIGSSASAVGLEYLARLPLLKVLLVENVRSAEDLSFVMALKELQEFGISGAIWTQQRIQNLWPLKSLQKLNILWMINARVVEDGLSPLHGHSSLITLNCAFSFPKSDFEVLRSSCPKLKFGSPFEEGLIEQFCKD